MDHDRAEGEGVAPQEYTAIKIELLETEWTADMKKTLKKGSKAWFFCGGNTLSNSHDHGFSGKLHLNERKLILEGSIFHFHADGRKG